VTAGDFCKINTEYAATLLDALSAAKLHDTTLVLVGSAAEYGPLTEAELPAREDGPIRPADFYGASKLAQTFLGLTAARRGQRVIIARPSNLIGPGMSSDLAIGAFVHQLAAISRGHQERSILVGDLSGSRDFIDVKDAADFIVRLAYNPSAAGQVVNICAGHPTSLSSILETLLNQFERRSPGAVAVKRRQIDSTATSSKVHFSCNRLLLELLGSAEYTPLQATLSRTLDAALTTGNSKPDANIQ
jgi:GDP-4-dehydro-6-deoxy-D-mannose reductase